MTIAHCHDLVVPGISQGGPNNTLNGFGQNAGKVDPSVLARSIHAISFKKRRDVMESPFRKPTTLIENALGNNSNRQAKSSSKKTQENRTKTVRSGSLIIPQLAQGAFSQI